MQYTITNPETHAQKDACKLLFYLTPEKRKENTHPTTQPHGISRLDGSLVRDRDNSLWEISLRRDNTVLTGLDRLPLQVNVGTVLSGLLLLLSVGLDTVDELSSAL